MSHAACAAPTRGSEAAVGGVAQEVPPRFARRACHEPTHTRTERSLVQKDMTGFLNALATMTPPPPPLS